MGQPDRLGRRLRTHRRLFALRQCRRKAYPPILAVAGLTDPRVTYWEPAKWVAKAARRKTGDNPVLFKINMESGHAGASGRFSRLEEIAFNYAFALKVVGRSRTPEPLTRISTPPGAGAVGSGAAGSP
jgi:prolyl oligopeptidase PreP (S9A serine peptidase family)